MNSPTQNDLFIKMVAFVRSLLPLDAAHVVQGQGNLTSMPKGPCVVISPAKQTRLSTNITTSNSIGLDRKVKMPTEFGMRIDCYGPDSSDYATTLAVMWRDQFGVDTLSPVAAPLYAENPVQMPLTNAEKNYEQRWTFTVMLQFNPVVSAQQQYADELSATLINVDVVYPPTE